jgi:hypothetical protein
VAAAGWMRRRATQCGCCCCRRCSGCARVPAALLDWLQLAVARPRACKARMVPAAGEMRGGSGAVWAKSARGACGAVHTKETGAGPPHALHPNSWHGGQHAVPVCLPRVWLHRQADARMVPPQTHLSESSAGTRVWLPGRADAACVAVGSKSGAAKKASKKIDFPDSTSSLGALVSSLYMWFVAVVGGELCKHWVQQAGCCEDLTRGRPPRE